MERREREEQNVFLFLLFFFLGEAIKVEGRYGRTGKKVGLGCMM